MILSVTFVPAAVALFVPGEVATRKLVFRAAQRFMRRCSTRAALAAPSLLRRCARVLCRLLATRMGIGVPAEPRRGRHRHARAAHPRHQPHPGRRHADAARGGGQDLPEVDHIVAKIGTADIATDPMPPCVADNFIILKDREEWPDPRKPKRKLVADLEAAVREVPGNNYEFTQPIQMRFNELLRACAPTSRSKSTATISTSSCRRQTIENIVNGARRAGREGRTGCRAAGDVRRPNREALARYGLNVAVLQVTVVAATGGELVGKIFEGDRRSRRRATARGCCARTTKSFPPADSAAVARAVAMCRSARSP